MESVIPDKTPGKPASKTAPKPMPKEKKAPASLWRKKKTEEDSDASAAAAASSSRAPAKKTVTHKVKKIEPHSDTSEQAKELFKDAEASQEVYKNLLQSFTNIQWFGRPSEIEPCKNVDTCQSEQAISFAIDAESAIA